MFSLLKLALGGVKAWQIYLVVFAVGVGSGGWAVAKVWKAEQVSALEKIIKDQAKSFTLAMDAQKEWSEKRVARAEGNIIAQEVIKHVKNNRVCDIPVDTARVLESSRQGLPTVKTTDSPTSPKKPMELSQRQELAAHFDLANAFHDCRDEIIRYNQSIGH